MRIFIISAYSLILLICGSACASAANTAGQNINVNVNAINVMTVSSGSLSLTIGSVPSAGAPPGAGTDSSSTYSFSTNGTNMKILASLDQAMPAGTTLTANLAAPKTGASMGAVALSTTPTALAAGITRTFDSGKIITYSFSITMSATPGAFTRTVTFTLSP